MTYSPQFAALLHRLGHEVTVRTHSKGNEDRFGNPESSWTDDRTVICLRSYPNRNTEITGMGGGRDRDRPVFFFPDDENNDPPGDDARIVYEGTTYEMKAPTVYESHVEMFGEVVTN